MTHLAPDIVTLKVWGDYACFTRPEHKVERVSYDLPTPSAARGILEGILWKPEFHWRILRIVALKEVRRLNISRNEIKTPQKPLAAAAWATREGGYRAEDDHTPRHSLILKDVAYLITARIVLNPHTTEPVEKYMSMFKRRARKGQSFQAPYLGSREFTCAFGRPTGSERPANLIRQLGGEYAERAGQLALGPMLFDMRFHADPKGPIRYRQHGPEGVVWATGAAYPVFFDAVLTDGGVLDVPQHLYEQVRA